MIVRRRRLMAVAVVGFLMLGLMGCLRRADLGSVNASPQPTVPQERGTPNSTTPTTKVNPKLVIANTRFGFKLFSELLKQDPKQQNVFISPSSVAIALGMLYNGASGTTQVAMAKTLEVQGLSVAELNQANADMKALLANPDPKVQLAIANSLWARQDIVFNPEFIRRNQQFYDAQVTALNFADPQAKTTINNWVKQNTQGKIPQIVDQISPDHVMFLINAIYFKGLWSNPFDRAQTTEKPFKLADGRQQAHPMMVQADSYRYYETEQFQAISLPYGSKRMSMYVFLPKETSSLSEFTKTLTAENWQQWMQQFRSRQGAIEMPRFKLEYSVELKDALSALGMGVAFDRAQANFADLTATPTKIDQVKHKTFVEVNEEGTEAAAATSIGMVATSIQTDEPFRMVVNRPFFCAIRDNQSGTVVFMGAIADPKI